MRINYFCPDGKIDLEAVPLVAVPSVVLSSFSVTAHFPVLMPLTQITAGASRLACDRSCLTSVRHAHNCDISRLQSQLSSCLCPAPKMVNGSLLPTCRAHSVTPLVVRKWPWLTQPHSHHSQCGHSGSAE